jgi:hypothetical protein
MTFAWIRADLAASCASVDHPTMHELGAIMDLGILYTCACGEYLTWEDEDSDDFDETN